MIELYNNLLQCPYKPWSHQNSLSVGTGALPKGIKRPTRSADYSSLNNNGVKNARAIYLPSSSIHIDPGAISNSYPFVPGLFPKG
jgi:hypothetical protein